MWSPGVNRGERALVQDKAMEQEASVHVAAHDLAGGVDPKRIRAKGARKIDQGKRAFVQKEAVVPGGFEATHDLSSGVDVDGLSISGARRVDRGEDAVVQEKTCSVGSAGLTSTAQAIATSLLAYAGVGGVVV
jgi:hypothetical protein